VHLFLFVWALRKLKSKNPLAYAILFYFISFSIASNLIFPIGTNMGERFMFIPSIGFCFGISNLIFNSKFKWAGAQNLKWLLAVCLVFSILSVLRNPLWKNNYTLFSHDVLVSKNSGKINADLAGELILKATQDALHSFVALENTSPAEKEIAGNRIKQKRDSLLLISLPLCKKALAVYPIYGSVWLDYAKANHYLSQNVTNTAEDNFMFLLTALEAYKQADLYKSLNYEGVIKEHTAACLKDLGKHYGEKLGNIDKAIACLLEAEKLDTSNAETCFLLGTAFSMKNDYPKMLYYAEKSLKLRPNDRATMENLAAAWQIYGAVAGEREYFQKAEKLLLEVAQLNLKLADTNPQKKECIYRTYDLLQKNYGLQGLKEKQTEYLLKMKNLAR
jgi:protein O-mannosyl-transferase